VRAARWTVLGAVVVLVGAAIVPTTAGARQQTATDEIGVTDDTIRIAVIADVENPVRPGLFQGTVEGVQAAAEYVNRKGGIGGRELQVDFIDSHLNADEARSALIRACEEDFALVGTSALFMNNIDPMVQCVDAAGNPTGIPDIANLQTEIAHQCSPVSYPVVLVGIDCSTAEDPSPRFTLRTGHLDYYKKRFGELHGPFILAKDLKSTINAFLPTIAMSKKKGVEVDSEFRISGLDPQPAFTPIAQQIKADQSNYVSFGVDYKADVLLRREAVVQGVDSVDVWDCTLACYDQRLIEEGGNDVEGQFTNIFFTPLEEGKQNKGVREYVKAVGGLDNASAFGIEGWMTVLLFRDVANRVIEADGEDGLTRARFLDEIKNVHDFDADGISGPIDVGRRKLGTCVVVLQVQDGEWKRAHPKKKGTFDCKSKLESVRVDLE
jgi:ABC-type branched-subunit amino acid transport system substrate-binding protein